MKRRTYHFIVMALVSLMVLTLTGCGRNFELRSAAFQNNGRIPDKYCYGDVEGRQNMSPPLNWVNPPKDTQSFALTMWHPNHNWIRWAVFNIPADCNEIYEDASGKNMPKGSIELSNFRRTSPPYYGPEPQPGGTEYEYIFTIYALNTAVIEGLEGHKTYTDINNILEGKVIAKAELTGTHSKQRQ